MSRPAWLGLCRDCGALRVKVTPYIDAPSRVHVVYYCRARMHRVDGCDKCDFYRSGRDRYMRNWGPEMRFRLPPVPALIRQ